MQISKTKLSTETIKTWLPNPKETIFGAKNPNYLESLTAGVFSPLFHLPYIFAANVLMPLIFGCISMIAFIFLAAGFGVAGRVSGAKTIKLGEIPLTDIEMEAQLDEVLKDTGYIAIKLSDIPTLVCAGVKLGDRVVH